MRRISRRLSVLALLLVVFAGMQNAVAQVQQPLPTIISFTSDIERITVADAEAGETETRLSWHTVGMSETYTLTLYSYWQTQWVALNEEPLPVSGELQVTVEHPLTFAPPTYRLVIHNADGTVVDERVLSLPYDVASVSDPPVIETFAADVTQVNADALSRGAARVQVTWYVANRPPTANLAFVQVLGEEPFPPVELPRPNLWVSSAGQGSVVPVLPDGDDTLRLRLRLVDMVDGSVYDERDLTIAIVGEPDVVPPAVTPDEAQGELEIVSFTVSPETVDRGGTVTLNWEIRGASEQTIWRLIPGGPIAEWLEDTPAIGSWTVTLPDYYVDHAMFQLWATDADENRVSESVTVQVRCPYTYFFGEPQGESCPIGEAREIAAVAQPFEHGTMLWRSDRGLIYVLYDNSRLERYEDTWQEGETFDVGEPSAGLVQPVRGFGKVWATHSFVRDSLGWATEPEQAYTMQLQTSGAYKYANTYFTLPDDRVVAIVENSWRFVGD